MTRYLIVYTYITRYLIVYTYITRYLIVYTYITRYLIVYTYITRYLIVHTYIQAHDMGVPDKTGADRMATHASCCYMLILLHHQVVNNVEMCSMPEIPCYRACTTWTSTVHCTSCELGLFVLTFR